MPCFAPRFAAVFSAIAIAPRPRRSLAQTYPSAPVKVVVPFGAGGATDILARVFSDRLQATLGQSFTVENRGGAAGQIAAAAVARSPADGSTLMFTTAAPITIAPLMNDKVQYDPRKDFVPVAVGRGDAGLAAGQCRVADQVAGRHHQECQGKSRASSPTAPPVSAPNCISPPRRWRARPGSRWCMCRSAAAAR